MEGFLHPYKRVHPYESVSISLCNLRSMPLNVRSESMERRFRVFERRNDKDAETNSLWFNDFSLWFNVFSCPLLVLFFMICYAFSYCLFSEMIAAENSSEPAQGNFFTL